jgi:hypothetical protein
MNKVSDLETWVSPVKSNVTVNPQTLEGLKCFLLMLSTLHNVGDTTCFCFFNTFEAESHCISQAGFKLSILLPQSPEC